MKTSIVVAVSALLALMIFSTQLSASDPIIGEWGPLPGTLASGDVNGDGKVDEEDAELLFLHIMGENELSSTQAKRGDVYGNDGAIDIRDYNKLYAIINAD